MEKKISPYELLSSMFILPYGSAILFYLAPDAKQDAWFSMLFYIIPAIILVLVHIKLFEFYPNDTLVTYMPKIFGKFLGSFLSLLYIIYFIYASTRVLRDFSSLIVSSSMPQTSVLFISSLIMIVVIYGVIVGIQTLSRASEILFIIMMLGLLFAVLFLVNTKFVLNIDNLFPMFENGILFPIKKGWPLITFPYGEFTAFTMIYKNLNDTSKIKKIAISAVILEGVCLTIINILFITALGVDFASACVFPLLETLRLIKIGGFLERLDILIIVTMVIAGFMKISFFMYFSVLGITDFFKIKSTKLLSIIVGIIILFSSEIIAKNFPQHLKIGLDITVKYIHLPMQTMIPLLALITAWFKNKSKNKPY